MNTSGATDPVWIHDDPYSNRPQFSHLSQDLETDVVVIGSGTYTDGCNPLEALRMLSAALPS